MEREHQLHQRAEPEYEHGPGLEPRISVACLAAYNAGTLHGTWIRADGELEDINAAVEQMLQESPEPRADYAIHDYDEFGCVHLGEYTDLATVNRLAQGLAEHGCAFGHWADHVGHDPEDLDRFEEAYRGHWNSLADYAQDLLDDLGTMEDVERAVPEWIQPYITVDWEMLGHDLASDLYVTEDRAGVWVFDVE